MTRKIYRTAMGKMVDLGALQLQNENVRAVGNMGVNARGDLLDSKNKPIRSQNEQVAKQYSRQVTNVTTDKVYSDAKAVDKSKSLKSKTKKTKAITPENTEQAAAPQKVEIPQPPEDFDDNFVKEEIKPAVPVEKLTGLAAAIAKSRQIKQEPLKTPQQLAKEQGLRKL